MSKKVFHIRIDSPGYNSDAIEQAFIDEGFHYLGFKWQEFRFSLGPEMMRTELLKQAKAFMPDVIFAHIQNSEAIDIETWEELSKIGFVINYTFDVRSEEKIKWMYDLAPKIGYTVFACSEDVVNCHNMGISNVMHSHSSCDTSVHKVIKKGLSVFDVVFVGGRYDNTNLNFPLAHQRQRMIEKLEQRYGQNFMVYGHGQKGGLIKPDVESSVYNFSKIAVNQNNFSLKNYTSDRIWRIMASGCFCLSHYFPGIEKIFQKEVHLDWFHDFDEMVELIDFYLENEEERKAIADVGSKYVRENHDWNNRILHILETTFKNKSSRRAVVSG